MQVFEFHFNPKAKEDVIYDSFVFEPENIWEKRMGRLYMVGHISNVLPQNRKLLEGISSKIKKEYYRVTERSPELALKEGLARANDFLSEEVKKGNVDWLGNLDFAVFSLKDNTLNFTSTGEISLLLIRDDHITDINQNLRLQEIEPYPLKIFSNIIAGKMISGDRILALTKEVFDYFLKENLLEDIADLEKVEEKKIKRLFQEKEVLSSKISGICFLLDLIEKETVKGRVTLEKKILPLSFWQKFKIFSKKRQKKLSPKKDRPKKEKSPAIRLPAFGLPSLRLPALKLPTISLSKNFKNNLFLLLFLIFILVIGGILANLETKKETEKAKDTLAQAEEIVQSAKKSLAKKDTEKANLLYQEAWQKVSPLSKTGSPVENEAIEIKNFIESQLLSVNKLEIIDNPELVFDFENLDFFPQRIIESAGLLYLFNPLSPDIYKIKGEGKELIKIDEKFSFGASIENQGIILFFSRPNKIFSFKQNQFSQAFFLRDPYSDYQFDDFAIFRTNLYFLDQKNGEILRYLFNENWIESEGTSWLDPEGEKPVDARSLAVDGSVWILNKNYEIEKYTAGSFDKKLNLIIFPFLVKPDKIFTSETLPYLYILDPLGKRIIITNKEGKIIRQFQSEKFDSLKDFSVSSNAKTIYLLNGVKVYQVSF